AARPEVWEGGRDEHGADRDRPGDGEQLSRGSHLCSSGKRAVGLLGAVATASERGDVRRDQRGKSQPEQRRPTQIQVGPPMDPLYQRYPTCAGLMSRLIAKLTALRVTPTRKTGWRRRRRLSAPASDRTTRFRSAGRARRAGSAS